MDLDDFEAGASKETLPVPRPVAGVTRSSSPLPSLITFLSTLVVQGEAQDFDETKTSVAPLSMGQFSFNVTVPAPASFLVPCSLFHVPFPSFPASSGRHCRATEDREPATARNAFTSPSVASALLFKHRTRGNEIGRIRSWMTLVMSTLKLRSSAVARPLSTGATSHT